nr:hypothetical protein CFP56_10984 [Quercus suber]
MITMNTLFQINSTKTTSTKLSLSLPTVLAKDPPLPGYGSMVPSEQSSFDSFHARRFRTLTNLIAASVRVSGRESRVPARLLRYCAPFCARPAPAQPCWSSLARLSCTADQGPAEPAVLHAVPIGVSRILPARLLSCCTC